MAKMMNILFSMRLIKSVFIRLLFNQFGLNCINHFVWIRNDTAQATEMFYRYLAIYCQANVFYHLTGIELYCQDAFHLPPKKFPVELRSNFYEFRR